MQVFLVSLQAFCRSSLLKCALQPKIAKNSLKPFWGVQGRSRSSILINLKSLVSVLVMISSMSAPICSRFHTKRDNNGKITSFQGYASLTPSFEGTPAPRGTKFCHEKLESSGQPQRRFCDSSLYRFDTVHECDRRTDGRTDARAMAKTREAFCYRA